MERLIEIFERSELPLKIIVSNGGVSLGDAFIAFNENTVSVHFSLRCTPDLAGKITMLTYAYCKAYEKNFEFGTVYAAKFDPLGYPESIVFGEEAKTIFKENAQRIHQDNVYYDYLMENADIKDLHSC